MAVSIEAIKVASRIVDLTQQILFCDFAVVQQIMNTTLFECLENAALNSMIV